MNSKRKGSAGERELCSILKEAGFMEAHRNDQRYVGGMENPDIALNGYHVECKRAERFNAYEAISQAERDANGLNVPIVAHRRNRKPWLIVMKLDDFMKLERNARGKTSPLSPP
ncbi:MAG: hypothetical protein GX096_07965 [Clostridiales bacterium]|nr:hypothetical protein [Clostridiales bacterium]